ncbi:hypothetical protein HNR60_003312 [Rhodopseudomonas rhenobacensis]|uniref:Cthe-2314-like HEPN domain-containing protein n=1 Tax=Rhodopseudomonas rhenobacensis TaxID=87461 RepID=A0A7W8E047_9BRAD|nr:hypothetical protein [Rhodopseudomonas rhenobacensis]MBB5048545.1 hypothetical protein [Rhodopseudomonas rhenobacensis]
MFYSKESMEELARSFEGLGKQSTDLLERYLTLDLKNARAREFATQGFPRRLQTMVRCINHVFTLIPPERNTVPTGDELADATIHIQCFVFNVFGSLDNLAWIWVCETGQKRSDATPIKDRQVGLGPGFDTVRETLPQGLKEHLESLKGWFDHTTNLRHALAHRIPLYIPPYVIKKEDEAAYHAYQTNMAAAIHVHDFAEYDRLSAEQLQLGRFMPWVKHSFEENAHPVVFHPQMLADFNTVEELGRKMLDALAA